VIATGFDSEYFHEQVSALGAARATTVEQQAPERLSGLDEAAAVDSVNMDLDQTDAAAEFASDTPQNIWDQPAPVEEDDESDMPAFLRRRKKNKSDE